MTEELNKLWLAHREAAFAHYGATSYRAAMCLWMPPAANEASDIFLAKLSLEREQTGAAFRAAWDAAYPEAAYGAIDEVAYAAQQRSIGQMQVA